MKYIHVYVFCSVTALSAGQVVINKTDNRIKLIVLNITIIITPSIVLVLIC